jgi:prepilin peptidase CpaA
MKLFSPEMWAIWCTAGVMVIAAIINARTLTVPNRLSLAAIVLGWSAALAINCSIGIPSNGGGIVASLISAGVGFGLLMPFYSKGWLGAGCVKMQMAFGAWVGCALGLVPAAWVTAAGTLAGMVITAVAVGIAVQWRRLQADAQPGFRLFPAQITLSIGSIGGAIVPVVFGWVQ